LLAGRVAFPRVGAGGPPRRGSSRLYGSTPMSEVLAWVDEQEGRGLRHPILRAHRSMALANLGRYDEARAIQNGLEADFTERGAKVPLAHLKGQQAVDLELFAGNPAEAAKIGQDGCRMLEELGYQSWLSTALTKLGEAYFRLGRLDDADEQALRALELGAS